MTDQSIQIILSIVLSGCFFGFFAYCTGFKSGYEKCFKDTEAEVKETILNNQIFS